jgi:hypothetical protein
MKGEIQPRMYNVDQVNWPSLLTDRKQTHNFKGLENRLWRFRKFPKLPGEIQRKKLAFL